jgi:hypothetical protein
MNMARGVSVIAAFSFLAGAIWVSLSSAPRTPGLSFVQAELDLGQVPLSPQPAVFVVKNSSSKTLRVLNVAQTCTLNCCFSSRQEEYVLVLPHSEVEYVVEITVKAPGPFEIHTNVFVDDLGLRAVPVTIRGTGVGVERPPGVHAD